MQEHVGHTPVFAAMRNGEYFGREFGGCHLVTNCFPRGKNDELGSQI